MYQRDQIEDPITCLVHKVAETKIRAILSRIPHFKAWMKTPHVVWSVKIAGAEARTT